ncbi:hypothetical protein SAY86_024127 [Trapa natans]|uniref:Uncharacterized protein n=1 Tax=Trapa natans TaxID=22666 RepID=A0AAN7LVZ2_TRANT|nr:hypothetical protein SAY86_024127 [Trapa natans]
MRVSEGPNPFKGIGTRIHPLLARSEIGRRLKLVKLPEQKGVAGAVHEEVVPPEEEATTTIHERLMRVNTNDYGRYDPAPSLVRPPSKVIPN